MGISIENELNECRVMRDQWHHRFETKSGPHFRTLLGIGDETAIETYPGIADLPLPHGHHVWLAFREDGADEMTLYFCPPPFRMTFRVDDRRVCRFFDQLFREGDGYTARRSEKAASEAEREDIDSAREHAYATR